jgi:hypothetical protein
VAQIAHQGGVPALLAGSWSVKVNWLPSHSTQPWCTTDWALLELLGNNADRLVAILEMPGSRTAVQVLQATRMSTKMTLQGALARWRYKAMVAKRELWTLDKLPDRPGKGGIVSLVQLIIMTCNALRDAARAQRLKHKARITNWLGGLFASPKTGFVPFIDTKVLCATWGPAKLSSVH